MDCAVDCDCYDADCVLACPMPQECLDCFEGTPCHHECTLSCEAIGPREGKGCADTLRCCSGLPEQYQRDSCQSSVANVSDEPGGDAVCATLYSVYAGISSTCD